MDEKAKKILLEAGLMTTVNGGGATWTENGMVVQRGILEAEGYFCNGCGIIHKGSPEWVLTFSDTERKLYFCDLFSLFRKDKKGCFAIHGGTYDSVNTEWVRDFTKKQDR